MSDPRITKIDNPEWGEYRELGEILAEAFAIKANLENEGWFEAYFPFFWSCGDDGEASDGMGGPPVSNPLEFRVYLEDMSTNAAVTRHYDLGEIFREDKDDKTGADGKYVSDEQREWATRTADALEALARDLRAAL